MLFSISDKNIALGKCAIVSLMKEFKERREDGVMILRVPLFEAKKDVGNLSLN